MPKKAAISSSRCDRSPFCPAKRACPQKAITSDKQKGFSGLLSPGVLSVDPALCTGCGVCVNFCPHGAITMK